MKYSILFTPSAELDIAESKKWYQERREGLGEEFVYSIDAAVNAISRKPLHFRIVKKNFQEP